MSLWIGTFKANTNIYAGTGESLSLWGPQLERGVQPTSLVPTNDAPPAMRAEDIAFVRDLDWLAPGRGTIAIAFSRPPTATQPGWVFQLGDETGEAWIGVHASAMDVFEVAMRADGEDQGRAEFPLVPGQPHVVALAWDEDSWRVSVDGGVVESRSAVTVPAAPTKLDLGDSTPSSAKLAGHIASMRYHPCRRADEELRALSQP
jgi:hypothetical protein